MEKEKQLSALREALERIAAHSTDKNAVDTAIEALAVPQSEPQALSVTHVPADSLRPQSANLHSGDEVWVRGKFLRYRDDGKIAVQLYPNDQNFFTAEQVKQALLASGHSTGHAVVLKDELNGLLAAAAPKPADLGQEQTHFCQNTKQIELTSLSACSCVEPDAFKPAPPASRDRDDSCPCCNRMKCICKAKPAPACEAPPEITATMLTTCLWFKVNETVDVTATVQRLNNMLRRRALAASVPMPTGEK